MKIEFDDIYSLMTLEEQTESMYLLFCGYYDRGNNTVLMGQDAYNSVMEYRQKMIDKYSPILHQKEEEKLKKVKPKIKSEQTWKKKWKRN